MVAAAISLACWLGVACGERPKEAPAGDVLAVVGDRAITADDLRARLARLPGGSRRASAPGAARAELDRMIEALVVEQEATRRGLDREPRVRAQLDALQARLAAEKQQVLRRALIDDLAATVEISDDELRAHYEQVKDRYRTSVLKLRRIDVADEAAAEAARKRILAGEDFAAVAAEVSTDPALRESGGALPTMERSQIPPSLRAAAYRLREPGEVGEPFQTDGGWTLLQLVERQDSVVRSFESVRSQLERELRSRQTAQRYGQLLEERLQTLGVDVDDEKLREFGPPEAPADRGTPSAVPPTRSEPEAATSEAPSGH